MLKDEAISKAVSRILQRSERQEDLGKLLDTYVDIGLLPQLDNNNHQVLYGRRGTGKTHVMRVLGSRISENEHNTFVYIDARTLGSTNQFSDFSVPLPRRCLSLFRDIFLLAHQDLLEHIVEKPHGDSNKALGLLDELATAITEPQKAYRETAISTEATIGHTSSRKMGLDASAQNLSGSITTDKNQHSEEKLIKTVSVEEQDKIIFPDIHRILTALLNVANTHLYIAIDEWSSLPADLQPYLAEFLKRSVIATTRCTLKIGALEYRSKFLQVSAGNRLGLELGADIGTAPDLDDYYVFDRNPERITEIYADVLYRHLSSELPENYLQSHKINNGAQLASRLFTERKTFMELARASEGVVRDLINIFTKSYFYAAQRDKKNIDLKAVTECARQWFEQDKSQQLEEGALRDVLRKIVDEVIGARKARSFLIPKELEKHPIIQKLFDARVLHLMRRGYADKDTPGLRYNIYALDYGTYVDLINTSAAPQVNLAETTDEENAPIVPFDDNRSIRRIILDESVLQ